MYNFSCFPFSWYVSSLRSSYWRQPTLSSATMNAAVLALRTMQTTPTGSEQTLPLLRCGAHASISIQGREGVGQGELHESVYQT